VVFGSITSTLHAIALACYQFQIMGILAQQKSADINLIPVE
jgi:hypothetical protein